MHDLLHGLAIHHVLQVEIGYTCHIGLEVHVGTLLSVVHCHNVVHEAQHWVRRGVLLHLTLLLRLALPHIQTIGRQLLYHFVGVDGADLGEGQPSMPYHIQLDALSEVRQHLDLLDSLGRSEQNPVQGLLVDI